jgi:hypothetical protein
MPFSTFHMEISYSAIKYDSVGNMIRRVRRRKKIKGLNCSKAHARAFFELFEIYDHMKIMSGRICELEARVGKLEESNAAPRKRVHPPDIIDVTVDV